MSLVPALCQALAFVRAGKIHEAVTVYEDRGHASLHALSAAVDRRDAKLGNQLFRIHAKVERDLASRSPHLAADLRRLIEASSQGFRLLKVPAPPCSS